MRRAGWREFFCLCFRRLQKAAENIGFSFPCFLGLIVQVEKCYLCGSPGKAGEKSRVLARILMRAKTQTKNSSCLSCASFFAWKVPGAGCKKPVWPNFTG